MTVGDWMITLLVLALPLVNIIMYLVWAFSGTGNIVGISIVIGAIMLMFGLAFGTTHNM